MFSLNDSMRYWLYSEPTDMRKSFHTLSGLVCDKMGKDPVNGDVYVFVNRHRNRIKLLHWESGGLVLYAKMLERGTFGNPSGLNGDGTLAWRDLVMLIEGMVMDKCTRLKRLDMLKEGRCQPVKI